MDSNIPPTFELSTVLLLAQTLFDLAKIVFKKTKKRPTLTLQDVLPLSIGVVFMGWFVWFMDTGYRFLIALMQEEGGLSYGWATSNAIIGYYLGYNLAKRLNKQKRRKISEEETFANNLFVYLPIGVLGSIFFSFTVLLIKNRIFGM